MRLRAQWAPLLTAGLMSFLMVVIITGALNLMSDHASLRDWMRSFVRVWPIAFAAVLAVLPLVRRVVATMTYPAADADEADPPRSRR